MVARLLRLLRGDKRDYAPMSPISLELKLSEMFARLLRLLMENKRDYAPTAPI